MNPRDPAIAGRIMGARSVKCSEWSHPAWGATPHLCAHPLASGLLPQGTRNCPRQPGLEDRPVAGHPRQTGFCPPPPQTLAQDES